MPATDCGCGEQLLLDRGGHYTTRPLKPGDYKIEVDALWPYVSGVFWAAPGGSPITGDTIHVSDGDDIQNIDVIVPKIQVTWGDFDCDGLLTIGDAQKIAHSLIGLPTVQDHDCTMPGHQAMVDGMPRTWGDLDCMNGLTIGDAQKTARWLINLSVGQAVECPLPGSAIQIAT